jgi:hypothetical protein
MTRSQTKHLRHTQAHDCPHHKTLQTFTGPTNTHNHARAHTRGWKAEDAVAPFIFAGKQPFLGFRDASFQPVTFELSILDIARGVEKVLGVSVCIYMYMYRYECIHAV